MKMIEKVCNMCGSVEVHLNTIATWNFLKQDWVFGENLHTPWCEQCECEISIEDREETA